MTDEELADIRRRADDPANCYPPRAAADIRALLAEVDTLRATLEVYHPSNRCGRCNGTGRWSCANGATCPDCRGTGKKN